MSVLRSLAPAKVNLGLFVGPPRAADGRHELASVMQSISLCDEVTLAPAPLGAEHDELICSAPAGPPEANLAARALALFREHAAWATPPQRVTITKRIPVAAGLGGGSADAAATLRLAHEASGLGSEDLLLELAAVLGADVPAQVRPGRWLATGAGERLDELPPAREPLGVLVLPLAATLSTAAVYAEGDRLGLGRPLGAIEERARELVGALAGGATLPAATELLHNDLQRAAVSLCPEIALAISEVRSAGAQHAVLSGSGPTVLGLFVPVGGASEDGPALAREAGERLAARQPAAIVARSVTAEFALPRAVV